MEQIFIKLLDENLEYIDCRAKDTKVIVTVKSIRKEVVCPYYGSISSRTHSVYQRGIQDIPIQNKQTILLLNTRKIFCTNKECSKKLSQKDLTSYHQTERKPNVQ